MRRCLPLCLLTWLLAAGDAVDPPPPLGWALQGADGLALRLPPAWVKVMHRDGALWPVLPPAEATTGADTPLAACGQAGCLGLLTLLANGGSSLREMAPADHLARGGWSATEDPLARISALPARDLPELKTVLAQIPANAHLVAIIDCRRTGTCADLCRAPGAAALLGIMARIQASAGKPDGARLATDLARVQSLEALPVAWALRYGDLRLQRLCFGASLVAGEAPDLHAVLEGDFTADQVTRFLGDCGLVVADGKVQLGPYLLTLADGELRLAPAAAPQQVAVAYQEPAAQTWFAEGGCAWVQVRVPENLAGQVGLPGNLITKGFTIGLIRQDAGLHLEARGNGLVEEDLAPLRQDLPALVDPQDDTATTDGGATTSQGPGHFALCRFGEIFARSWHDKKIKVETGSTTLALRLPFASVGDALLAMGTLRDAWRAADDPLWQALQHLEEDQAGDL